MVEDSNSGSSKSQHARGRGHRSSAHRNRLPVTNIRLANFVGKPGEAAEAWLTRVERVLRSGKERRSNYVSFISLRLEGNASIWFDQLKPDVVLQYDDFKQAFLKQFQLESTSTYGAALRTLSHVKQEAQERVSAYGIRFGKGLRDLRHYTDIDDVTAVHKYATGLRAEFRHQAHWYIKKNEYLTVEDLGEKMMAREEHQRDERKYPGGVNAVETSKPSRPPAPEWLKLLASMKEEIQSLQAQIARGGQARTTPTIPRKVPKWTADGVPICLFCDQSGHMASECPRKVTSLAKGGAMKQQGRGQRWCNFHNRWGGHDTAACYKRPPSQLSQGVRALATMPEQAPQMSVGQQPPPQVYGRGRGQAPPPPSYVGRGGPVKQGFR